jgi:23S rRNA pseudouridine1911/1915/1917 synthase
VLAAQAALGRLGLHARRLPFAHPRTGRRLSFEAPIPDDFARALQCLRAGVSP